jgi:hypothetical protein
MNGVTQKDKMLKLYLLHSSLSFLILLVHFQFDFENYRDCKDISRERVQICSNIICHLDFNFF